MPKPLSVRAIAVRLVAGHALFAASVVIVLVCQRQFTGSGEHALEVVAMGTAIRQGALIGLWFGMATASTIRRWAFAVLGGVPGYAALAIATGVSDVVDFIVSAVFFLGPLIAAALFGTVLRRMGFVVEPLESAESGDDRGGVQFSLRHIFAITLAAAVLFGLIREIRGVGGDLPGAREYSLFLAFNTLAFALHTQICLWSALGAGSRAVRATTLVLFAGVGAGIFGFAFGGSEKDYLDCVLMFSVYSILVAGSLWALRCYGYRLRRCAAPLITTQEE